MVEEQEWDPGRSRENGIPLSCKHVGMIVTIKDLIIYTINWSEWSSNNTEFIDIAFHHPDLYESEDNNYANLDEGVDNDSIFQSLEVCLTELFFQLMSLMQWYLLWVYAFKFFR